MRCLSFLLLSLVSVVLTEGSPSEEVGVRRPAGPVRVMGHSLADEKGPFIGLGASYFTALWRCKYDRPRLEQDLAFLARQGFNYYRMLSMVGYYGAWNGLEIAPVSFVSREEKLVPAWPDYWEQLSTLIDLGYDKFHLRTQITIFADAQILPAKEARLAHMRKLLTEVVRGREHKILMLEIANEAWQNGFAGEQGITDLREFAQYLGARTEIPVAITSNHESPGAFEQLYAGGVSDLATWHFSRDLHRDEGWHPVYDCWDYADREDLPPVVSNEPVGPGSSVSSERRPVRLVMAAAFAYVAKCPAYVFHSEAGVFGKTRFEDTPAVEHFGRLLGLLPPDLANWCRNDGIELGAPFTAYAGGQANRYWSEGSPGVDGCLRNAGSCKDGRFVCVPIGIRSEGLTLEARRALRFNAYDPTSGKVVASSQLGRGQRVTLPRGPGALLLTGEFVR